MEATVEGITVKGKVVKIPNVDKTLLVEGAAADAKATGEAIEKVKDEVCNKPVGNYVGNGESQTIETGAKSKALLIHSDAYVALVTPLGAMMFYKDGSAAGWIPEVTFASDLYINTNHEAINAVDVTYSYQVL